MFWLVLGYFLLVAGVAALFVFPPYRSHILQIPRKVTNATARAATHAIHLLARSTVMVLRQTTRHGTALLKQLRDKRLIIAIALLIIAAPPLLALSLHAGTLFEFAESSGATDPRIAMLLEGERLSPPPSLTPAVFTTREVELIRPEAVRASRNWSLLDADFRQRLLLVFKLMRERHGYEMVLLEGYRSPTRQTRLAAQGRHVTQATAYQSYHQHGLAADCAFYRDGSLVISEKDIWAMRGYARFGELAASVGLDWGGNWKMRDYGHVELSRPEVLGRQTILATR